MWIHVTDALPPEETADNTVWFDVWAEGCREINAKFKDGEFLRQCKDHDGDYSHDERIDRVTYWQYIQTPFEAQSSTDELEEIKQTFKEWQDVCASESGKAWSKLLKLMNK